MGLENTHCRHEMRILHNEHHRNDQHKQQWTLAELHFGEFVLIKIIKSI